MPPESTFAQRLRTACDDTGTIPEYGHGRQVFISRKLKVSQEAVRKWFTGEARPRASMMKALASLLDVEEEWLALGVKPEMDRKQKRRHGQKTEGAIYMLYGMALMAGGNCAFPGEGDPRADYTDFYTIIRGVQFAVHVSTGRELSKNVYEFILPREYRDVRNLGVVAFSSTRVHIIDLKYDLVELHKHKRGGQLAVNISRNKDGHYISGHDEWPRLMDITELV